MVYPEGMLALAVLLALLVPAVAYATLIYLLDLHEREPPWALASAFVLGALAAPFTLAAERALLSDLPSLAPALSNTATLQWSCFGVIGPVEELAKLGVTLLFARRALMNEPVDGVVYAGFVSLGFAAGEGILGAKGLSAGALLLRALLPLPAHVFFSSLWGAGLGALRYWGRALWPWPLVSWLAAALLHGGYDYLLFVDGGRQRGSVVALLAVAGVLCALLFRALLTASPFRGVTTRAGSCVACDRPHGERSRFCAGCGELLVVPALSLPLSFAGTLLAFGVQAAALLLGTLASMALRQQTAPALWHALLKGTWWEAAPLLASLPLAGALAGLLSVRLRASGWLDLLVGSAFVWLYTLLYLTLSAPELSSAALLLLACPLLVACLVRAFLVRPVAAL